jgi:long-subunit acyl-CoA synthetase (AMP-forming)
MSEKLKSPTVFLDAKGNEVLSGLALWRMAHDRRHQLRAEGFKKGDLYFCQRPNGFEFLVDFMACIVGQYRFFPCQTLTPEEKQKAQDLVLMNPEISVFLVTGGTVRRKIIGLTENNIIHQIESHSKILELKSEETRLCLLPWSHSFGLVLDLLTGIYHQQTMIIARNSSAQEILKSLQNFDVQHMACVPRHLEAIKQKVTLENLKNVQIHFGGASLSEETLAWCHSRFKSVQTGYGLTEAGPGVLMNGVPVGCEVILKPSPFENLQEIWVRPQFPSFWTEKEIDSDGFFNTFDLARTKDNLIFIEGRNSDFFKTANGQWTSRKALNLEVKKITNCEFVDYNSVSNVLKIVIDDPENFSQFEALRVYTHKVLQSNTRIEIVKTDGSFWSFIFDSRKKCIEDCLNELKTS